MYTRHRLLFLILEVAAVIAIIGAIIPFISSQYASMVARLADLAAPAAIRIVSEKDIFRIYIEGYFVPLSLHSLPFLGGLVLILALLLFTPGIPLRKRPLYVVGGLACSIAYHVVGLTVVGLLTYLQVSRGLGRSISALFLSIGIDLFPVLIWFAISYKYWRSFLFGGDTSKKSVTGEG